MSEYSWKDTKTARVRFAALKIVDSILDALAASEARVDALCWDTHDGRHAIMGRDDVGNLQRMYFHLFRNIMTMRYPSTATWRLMSDEHTAMDWSSIENYLIKRSTSLASELGIPTEDLEFSRTFGHLLKRHFSVVDVSECRSQEVVLCQVADLFAGLFPFARKNMNRYHTWMESQNYTEDLFGHIGDKYSKSDEERFRIIQHLLTRIRQLDLCQYLETNDCLRTRNPNDRLNFWCYESQSPSDRAPTRQG